MIRILSNCKPEQPPFDETTQIRMYYFAGTRLNFQLRDAREQWEQKYLLDRSSEISGGASLEIYCVGRARLTSKIDIGGYLWRNVTKIEIDLPLYLKKFLRVSEKSFLHAAECLL